MMRYLIVVISLAVTSMLPLSAAAQSRAELLRELEGIWRWTTPDGCVVTRTFRADGTSRTLNGKKTTESTIAPRFDQGLGARLYVQVITKDEGGRNCDGESSDTTGNRYLAFFGVSMFKRELKLCIDPGMTALCDAYRRQ